MIGSSLTNKVEGPADRQGRPFLRPPGPSTRNDKGLPLVNIPGAEHLARASLATNRYVFSSHNSSADERYSSFFFLLSFTVPNFRMQISLDSDRPSLKLIEETADAAATAALLALERVGRLRTVDSRYQAE